MTDRQETYQAVIKETKAAGATLVAVSKQRSHEQIMELYDWGHRDFGENRDAELVEKYHALPKDIRWHFIGHLQRNKVKNIAPFVTLIHAVDSLRLLREIDKQAKAHDRPIPTLLQFHIAEEESKYGLDRQTVKELLQAVKEEPLSHARIAGVMGMATYTDNDEQIAGEFASLGETFGLLQRQVFFDDEQFKEVSMGMSGDYPIALEHGSTLVRVGSLLFN